MANSERLSEIIPVPWIFFLLVLASRIHDGYAIWYANVPKGAQFSYTVAIRINKPGTSCSICSGGIISSKHILTAAHCGYCVDDVRRYTVLVSDISSSRGSEIYTVKEIHRHREYRESWGKVEYCRQLLVQCILNRRMDLQTKNDIAVIKLDKELTLGESVSKIQLPLPSPLTYPVVCNFSSFGNTEESLKTGKPSPGFRWTRLTIIDPEECQQKDIALITEEILCTEYLPESRNRLDHGDSGGPLVCNGIVYGVYSQGPPNTDRPEIFTDVMRYLKFIFDILRQG